jgi:hypothetical protein
MESTIQPLADAIYADKVRRARGLTMAERIDTAIELFEGSLGMMRDGLRAQFPLAREDEVDQLLRKRLGRLRQVAEFGIYQKEIAQGL